MLLKLSKLRRKLYSSLVLGEILEMQQNLGVNFLLEIEHVRFNKKAIKFIQHVKDFKVLLLQGRLSVSIRIKMVNINNNKCISSRAIAYNKIFLVVITIVIYL